MPRLSRRGALMGGLVLGSACGTEQPTTPGAVQAPPTVIQSPTVPPQRLPSGEPVATYVFHGPLDYAVQGYTPGSQYLLYDGGVFGLRYEAFAHVYLGTYRQDSTAITFRFDGQWTWDQGGARGTLKGDLLEVRYSEIMQHSDFDNAVYRRRSR